MKRKKFALMAFATILIAGGLVVLSSGSAEAATDFRAPVTCFENEVGATTNNETITWGMSSSPIQNSHPGHPSTPQHKFSIQIGGSPYIDNQVSHKWDNNTGDNWTWDWKVEFVDYTESDAENANPYFWWDNAADEIPAYENVTLISNDSDYENQWGGGTLELDLNEPGTFFFDVEFDTDFGAAIDFDGQIYAERMDLDHLDGSEVELEVDSTAGGMVTEPGEGVFTYDLDVEADLVAEENENYQFVEWTGDIDTVADVNSALTTITMSDNYSITANFEEKEVPPPEDTDNESDNVSDNESDNELDNVSDNESDNVDNLIENMTPEEVIENLAIFNPDELAKALEQVSPEFTGSMIDAAVATGRTDNFADILRRMTPSESASAFFEANSSSAAKILELMTGTSLESASRIANEGAKANLEKTALILEEMEIGTATDLLIGLHDLLEIPEVTGDLLEATSLERSTAVIQNLIEAEHYTYAAGMFEHLADERLNAIWESLTQEQRDALLSSLSLEVKDRISALKTEPFPLTRILVIIAIAVASIVIFYGFFKTSKFSQRD